MLLADRIHRFETEEVSYIPLCAPPGQPCAMPFPGAYEFFTKCQKDICPSWENRTTVETLEKMLESDLSTARTMVAPAATLVVLCEKDELVPVPLAQEAFAQLGEPKKLMGLDCGHFPIYYEEPWLTQATDVEIAWYKEHLG